MTYLAPWLQRHWIRLLAHIGALLPLGWMVADGLAGNLTANPIQDLTIRTGKAGLILLVLSLACTPASLLSGLRQVLPLRRVLGLYGFLYITLHLLIFAVVDFGLDLELILQEIGEKRYILAGLAGFLLLLPLAVTSTRGWQRRLGPAWKRLHRLVYLAVPLGVVHFVWLVKSDVREPLIYAAIVGTLLALRSPWVKRAILRVRYRNRVTRNSSRAVEGSTGDTG
jgi:sulfoxide reductase heme-binding subunit YedZ